MGSWSIQPHKRDNALARGIKKKQREVIKIKEEIECNGESARKDIKFDSEAERKKMAQNFYRGSR